MDINGGIRINLRQYQTDIISQVIDSTSNRILVVAPCGAGKTVIAKQIISINNKNIWFIVHRRELLDQAVKTFKGLNVQVLMIQSIKNVSIPDIIIIDEAHHSTSNSYMKLFNTYPNAKIIGLTATPTRLNGKPLGDIYDYMINNVNANQLIEQGYLSTYDYYAPKIDVDFTRARIVAGDYSKQDIDFLMNKPQIYGDVIKNYNQLASGRQTIVYCSSIPFSKTIEQLFIENNINAVQFDGNTSKIKRDKIIEDFRNGIIQVLINVDLIGEGFDVPDCDCVLLLRPTQSTSLYIQQSTRCLRSKQDKHAIVIDFVGNVFRHGLPTEDREWSLTKTVECKNKKGVPEIIVRQCEHCYKCYQGTARFCPYCGKDNGKTRHQIEIANQIELQKIDQLVKLNKRKQQGNAQDYESLVALGYQRGYKNPQFWAKMIIKSRGG